MKRLYERLLLRPEDVPPSQDDFEVIGAFNPAAVEVAGEVLLLVRIAERPRERRAGYAALPRWEAGRLVVDWVHERDHIPLDPRVVQSKADGLIRLTFISHLRLVRCGDGRGVRSVEPITFGPQSQIEEYGVEDPRITPLDGHYFFTYVAVSRNGVVTALASTTDFQSFKRHGIIFCPENKDVVLFPGRLGEDYLALHRPNSASPFTKPEMWLARSPDLIHWGCHRPLLGGRALWESGKVGAGPPPIRTNDGWLLIYHGNRPGSRPGEVGPYAAGALLLDPQNPNRILGQTPESVLEPTAVFEREGFVPHVVFPTGIVERGESLLVYYGAADTATAVVELLRAELTAALRAGARPI